MKSGLKIVTKTRKDPLVNRREFIKKSAIAGAGCMVIPYLGMERSSSPFPELKVSGDPGKIGRAHGEKFKVNVSHNVDVYMKWLADKTGAGSDKILTYASRFAPVIEKYLPGYMEEMEGIAKGAGRKIEEILAVNARTDICVMGKGRLGAKEKPGCTALALSGKKGGKEYLALGQNWDWRSQLKGNTIILRLKQKGKPDLVTFTEAGMVGKIGFNERRLGVCLNFLSHKTDDPDGDFGVPVHCLLRAVMECETVEEAVKLISWVPRCASANFLIAQHGENGPGAVDIEWTSNTVARILMKDGILVHTNHFKNKVFGEDKSKGGTSYNRNSLAEELALNYREKTPDPAERIKKILSSQEKEPSTISRGCTLAGIAMDLTRNRLHIVSGPPHKGKWVNIAGV